MNHLQMPPRREFGWALKSTTSSRFAIHKRPNGQFAVVLNHALLRGLRADMVHWWFLNFPNLTVRLVDVPGYEGQTVPAYYLWHPIDHHSATLSGKVNPDGTARAGAKLHIREAMQYDRYGWKYPVDTKVKVFYVGPDGWAMGKTIPVIGPVMMLRIHFKDAFDGPEHVGVHYHYEVVIGRSGDNFVSRQINHRITSAYGTEFFDAWHRHNVIEVGVFENFLPALFAQRHDPTSLQYSLDMDPNPPSHETQSCRDQDLFERRLEGFKNATDPFSFQQYDAASFL